MVEIASLTKRLRTRRPTVEVVTVSLVEDAAAALRLTSLLTNSRLIHFCDWEKFHLIP